MNFPENTHTTNTIYIRYYKKYVMKKLKSLYHVDIKTFRKVVYLFNKKFAKALLDGEIIELPYALGELSIRKKPLNIKHAKLNLGEFVKSGLKTRYYNEHSDGFNARYYWRKKEIIGSGHKMYSFVPTIDNKRCLTKIMQMLGGHKRYLVL